MTKPCKASNVGTAPLSSFAGMFSTSIGSKRYCQLQLACRAAGSPAGDVAAAAAAHTPAVPAFPAAMGRRFASWLQT